MFDDKARVGSRNSLDGYGGGLAGRGRDINTAIAALVPLLDDLQPVATNLASPDTRLGRFFKELGDAAGEAAPVGEVQASLFVNLDTTFTALASVARPYIQETISESPPSEELAIREFPIQRPFLRNNAAFFRELRPGHRHAAPLGPDPRRRLRRAAPRCCPRRRRSTRTSPTCSTRSPTSPSDPLVPAGRRAAHAPVVVAEADARLPDARPDDLQLRDAVLPQRRQRALRRRRERHLAALRRSSPSPRRAATTRAARRRRRRTGHRARQPPPHQPLPEHRVARPDEGVRGGQRALHRSGATVIGNPPGNQGTETEDQPKARGASREAGPRTQHDGAPPRA